MSTLDYQRRYLMCSDRYSEGLTGGGFVVLFWIVKSFVTSIVKQSHVPAGARQGLSGATATLIAAGWEQADVPGRILAILPIAAVLILLTRGVLAYARSLRSEFQECQDALLEDVRPVARFAINQRANQDSPPLLRLKEAPSLSSVSDAKYTVGRPEQQRVYALVRELGASAVAISGPRGAGKSTLLKNLRDRTGPPFDLIVSIEAPASYNARDFTIMLYKAFCEEVLKLVS